MIPLRSAVKAQFLGLLDDPNAATFNDTVFQLAFQQGFDALFGAFLNHQCPQIQAIASYTLPATITSLTPATAGLNDFADGDQLEERLNGSTEKFTDLTQVDRLSQRDPSDKLMEFVWRQNTYWFVGATTTRELRITYESTGAAPTDDSTSIEVPNSLSFLSNFAVGMAGRRKGYDEIADTCMQFAVGPRYSQGQIGGELWRLVSARVRSMQHVQLQQRRYSVTSQNIRRRIPFIQVIGTGGGDTTITLYSYFAGTITGTLDGVNPTFTLSSSVTSGAVILNGTTLTPAQHYTLSGNVLTFLPPYIPQPGADILVQGWTTA